MQHSWRRLASETFRWHAKCLRQHSGFTISGTFFRPKTCLTTFRATHGLTRAFHSPSNGSLPVPPENAFPEEPVPEPSLSQISFEASRAIKIAVSEGNLADAFLVLNSIHYANNKQEPTLLMDKLSGMMSFKAFQLEAIPFQQGTPIRLAAHSLLHSLLREGYLEEACRLSEQLMNQGIRIQGKSLDTLFDVLTEPPPTPARVPVTAHTELWTANVLNASLQQPHIQHVGGSYALHLLNVARQSRQRRSRNMFKTLITLCIINGEIIAASLLFGLLVKDWNARVVEMENAPTSLGKKQGRRVREVNNRQTAWPSENRMHEIINSIDRHLRTRDYAIEGEHEASLQALANLAVLLDNRLIPFRAVGPLIRLIREAQHLKGKVHIPDITTGEMHEVSASVYFDAVLTRLSDSLPRFKVRHGSSRLPLTKSGEILPALDKSCYHELLIHALHNQRSTERTDAIFEHMTKARHPPLQPDAMTADIYRRGAILVDREELWTMAASFEGIDASRKEGVSMAQEYASSLMRYNTVESFCSKIDFLVEAGHPELVVGYVKRILMIRVKDKKDTKNRWKRLRHVMKLGPRVFVSILNALQKAGETTFATEVWELAREAQALSWTDRCLHAWTLPIEAYTIMINLYGAEGRRAMLMRRVQKEDGTSAIEANDKLEMPVGWGRQVMAHKRRNRYNSRGAVGQRMAFYVYNSAFIAHERFASRRPKSGRFHEDHKLPEVDRMFFAMILDVVSRHRHMRPRSKRQRLGRAKKVLAKAEWFFATTGRAPRKSNPALLHVGAEMRERGLPIPIGIQPFFVGQRIPYKDVKAWRRKSMYRLKVKRTRWRARREQEKQRVALEDRYVDSLTQ
ncbi:hypothetical protein BKA70DRAFT_1142100 [Coprinopsis sp. MPI-PUGE-AT-0042]|nr:hypothetical protein BKA70DRAFT_1142100 [Coprinopsis sp. MPI-PUGE-AT-0042]